MRLPQNFYKFFAMTKEKFTDKDEVQALFFRSFLGLFLRTYPLSSSWFINAPSTRINPNKYVQVRNAMILPIVP